MSWFSSESAQWAFVAAKGGLMYATALVGLRLGERRTLAQWTSIDFAAAVAMGAIVGRTTVDTQQSYVVGAIGLLTIIAAHRVASVARFNQLFNKLVDHRVRLLVIDGRLRRDQLRLCGLTDDDLYAELRLKGITSLDDLRYVLYEAKGGLTVVPRSVDQQQAQLVQSGLESAVGAPNASV